MKAVKTLIREKNILENSDLLLVSHLDELLSRESVYLAKHCHLKQSFVYGALIMPMLCFQVSYITETYRRVLRRVLQNFLENNNHSPV